MTRSLVTAPQQKQNVYVYNMCIQDAEKSIPKLHEVIGGTKTKIYCNGTICQRCVLTALRTIKLCLTKVGNQAKPMKYFGGGGCISYQIRADVKTYGDQPWYRADNNAADVACALKNARLLSDGCCFLNNTGNKILFRINWQRVNQSFNVVPQEEVHWCEVWWPGRLSHWPAPIQSSNCCMWQWDVDSEEDLISLSLRQ
jgi:hypothetical protein